MSAFPALVILAWHYVIFDALKKKKKNRFHSHTPAEIFTRETIRFKNNLFILRLRGHDPERGLEDRDIHVYMDAHLLLVSFSFANPPFIPCSPASSPHRHKYYLQ